MALIKCPECGREISEYAPSCPGCGITKEYIDKIYGDINSHDNEYENEDVGSASEEMVRYPTISVVTDSDISKYIGCHTGRRKIKCKVCKIKFDRLDYETCPLCKANKELLEMKSRQRLKNDVEYAVEDFDLSEYKTGDVIKFGRYNGVPIEWIILTKENNSVMVISREGLETRPYNESSAYVTWEDCTLRKYLNEQFVKKCFNQEEKDKIIEMLVVNNDNTEYGNRGGNDTRDKMFLLSVDEADKLFNSNKSRECVAARYAKNSGAKVNPDLGTSWWWLRSPGDDNRLAADVYYDGRINRTGASIYSRSGVVRPAMWIALK